MPAIDWGDSAKMGYLSRAWPAPTCCVYSFLSNYLILKTLLYGIIIRPNYLPHRQLRKMVRPKAHAQANYLPHRQLRKHSCPPA